MTLTIEVTPEVESALQAKAAQHGLSVEGYAAGVLERDAVSVETPETPQATAPQATDNPLAVALRLAKELGSTIKAGTRGVMDAAADVEANREERMRELDLASRQASR